MKTRFVKITLTLVMLLVMAVPTQAFAAEKYNINAANLIKNSNNSNIYNQFSQATLDKIKAAFTQFANGKIDTAQLQNIIKQCNKQATANVTPATPAKPAAPVAVSTPAKPAAPVAVSTPAKPAVPVTTPTPAKPTAPVAVPTPAKPAAPVAAPTPAKPAAPVAAPTASIGAYEQQVVDLVNKERAAVGLPALKVNTKLAAVAEKKAEDLRDKNYFAHQSPTYGSPFDMMKQFGISYSSAGENIAKGQKTPAAVMNGWMNSQGHKDNILNPSFTEIGVGYVTDSNGTTYWVQHFIRP